MSSQTKLGFLICPVRNGFDATAIVERLEADGWKIHYPRRDTPQNDPVGLNICRTNRAAISRADRVFIVWDGKSEGSLFDFGIAFALDKPVTVIEAPARTDAKSFQNVMRALEMEQAANHAQEH